MPQYIPIPNNPHRVLLAPEPATRGSDDAHAEAMAAIESGDDAQIQAVARKYARPNAQAVSHSRTGPIAPLTPHSADPIVVRARLNKLGRRDAKPERLVCLTNLKKDVQAMPSTTAQTDELLKLLTDTDADFAKLDREQQMQRVQQLRAALKPFMGSVEAARASALGRTVLLLSALPGRNEVERAVAMLRASDAAIARLPWEKQVRAAGELLRQFSNRV